MLEKKDKLRIVNRNYRHKIGIIKLNEIKANELGEIMQIEKKIYDLWAQIIPIRGKEYVEVEKLVPEMQYKIITRYRKDIDESMIIKWGDRKMNIKAIININGLNEHIEIIAIERVEICQN